MKQVYNNTNSTITSEAVNVVFASLLYLQGVSVFLNHYYINLLLSLFSLMYKNLDFNCLKSKDSAGKLPQK